MRICFVINQLYPGGAELLVSKLSADLSRKGHKIAVISLRFSDQDVKESFFSDLYEHSGAITIIENSSASMRKVSTLISFLRNARSFLLKFNPDIIHSHCEMPDIVTGFLAFGLRARRVRTAHNEIFFQRNKTLGTVVEVAVNKIVQFSVVIAISKKIKRQNSTLMKAGSVPLVYNGVQFPVLSAKSCKTAGSAKKVVIVGRLCNQKGQLAYIKYFLEKYMGSEMAPYELHIYGDGPDREIIEKIIRSSKCIYYHGLESEKSKIYEDKDFIVIPSRFEGLSTVMLEAIGYKIPVATLEVSGAEDICIENHAGKIFNDMAAMDEWVANTPCHELAEETHNVVKDKFSFERYSSQHEKIYERLIKNQKNTEIP